MIASDSALDGHGLATQRNPRLRILIPMVVAIAFLMEQLDSTIITTAIPDMARSLARTPVRMNLAVTAYGPHPRGLHSGSLTFLGSVGALLVRVLIGRLLRSLGFDKMLIGSAVAAAAILAGFALLGPDTPRWLIGAYIFVFGLIQAMQFMTSNTLSYADLPDAQLSQATSLGGVLQQLTVSFGVSLGAMLLSLVSRQSHVLTPTRFHEVFLLMAILPLLAAPAFMRLRPKDGAQVSGYRRTRRG